MLYTDFPKCILSELRQILISKNIDALADVNIIRARAGLSNLTNVSIDDILLEKRKEFVFENKYFFDLMRNHKNIERKIACRRL